MRSNDFPKEVMSILKQHANARGYTQYRLAKELNVSFPTLKRWLAGKAVTLDSLKKIADLLGVSFIEIASAIEERGKSHFQYTIEQEEYLARNPELLAFFDYLIRGYTPSKIQKKFILSNAFLERSLAKLEKLGLIDWLSRNRASLKTVGEPQWRKDGPLSKKFKSQIQSDFLENGQKIYERFSLHDYLPEDKLKIEKKLEEVLELSRQANARASVSQEEVEAGGLLISYKKFRWNLDNFLRAYKA